MRRPELRCDNILTTPRDIDDWSELLGSGKWSVVVPDFTVEQAREKLNDVGQDTDGDDDDVIQAAHEVWLESGDGDPMMNYCYEIKLHHDLTEGGAAALLDGGLPLTLLTDEDGNHWLALTGGGMDLSWEICAAYVALGQYPPAHFAGLPRMSGRGLSKSDRRLIRICIESCTIAARWATNPIVGLKAMLKESLKAERAKKEAS